MNKEHYERIRKSMDHNETRTRKKDSELWLYSVIYYRPLDRDKPEEKTRHEEHWVASNIEQVWKKVEREWSDELVDLELIKRQVMILGVIES